MKINTKRLLDIIHKDLDYKQYKPLFETEQYISLFEAKKILDDYSKKGLEKPTLEEIVQSSNRFYFKILDYVEEIVSNCNNCKEPYLLVGDLIVEHFNKYLSYSETLDLIFNSFSPKYKDLFYPLLHKEMTRRFQGLYSKRETENGGYDKMLHYLFSQYLTDKFYFLGLLAPLEKIFSIGEEPIRHILKDVKADLQGVFKYFHTISPKIVNHLNFSYLRKTL